MVESWQDKIQYQPEPPRLPIFCLSSSISPKDSAKEFAKVSGKIQIADIVYAAIQKHAC
jgi:hypothetical protein